MWIRALVHEATHELDGRTLGTRNPRGFNHPTRRAAHPDSGRWGSYESEYWRDVRAQRLLRAMRAGPRGMLRDTIELWDGEECDCYVDPPLEWAWRQMAGFPTYNVEAGARRR